MAIVYFTAEEIIEIHDKIIEKSGGHSGILSAGHLDFNISKSKIPKDMFRSISILFFGILTSHPFVDGNKRTAFECLDVFLKLNSKLLIAKEADVWRVLHEASEGKIPFEKIIEWIRKNSK